MKTRQDELAKEKEGSKDGSPKADKSSSPRSASPVVAKGESGIKRKKSSDEVATQATKRTKTAE